MVYDDICIKNVKAELLVIEVIVECVTFSSIQCCVFNMQPAYLDNSDGFKYLWHLE